MDTTTHPAASQTFYRGLYTNRQGETRHAGPKLFKSAADAIAYAEKFAATRGTDPRACVNGYPNEPIRTTMHERFIGTRRFVSADGSNWLEAADGIDASTLFDPQNPSLAAATGRCVIVSQLSRRSAIRPTRPGTFTTAYIDWLEDRA